MLRRMIDPPPTSSSRSGKGLNPVLKDVARLAGVSPATVSRALNTPDMLDADTLSRVQEAVRKLRYMPNAQARALRNQRSYTIGAVLPTFDYAFYSVATSALESDIEEHGYALFLASHHFNPAKEVRVTRALIERGVEAFMFVGMDHDPELFVLLNDFHRPYVLVWALDRSGRHPSIGFDIQAASFALADRLVRLGHRRFGMISAAYAGNDIARNRRVGVEAALNAHGLVLDPSNIEFTQISVAAGTEAMARLLERPNRPTAVITTNDALGVGALIACREANVAVPTEISVAGAGNSELGATHFPSLTSIRGPVAEVGRAAADYLMARLDGKDRPQLQEFPFDIIWRDSTGPAPKVRALKVR